MSHPEQSKPQEELKPSPLAVAIYGALFPEEVPSLRREYPNQMQALGFTQETGSQRFNKLRSFIVRSLLRIY
jgi:hypothetical protein